jgi:hypothetical protein
MKEMAKHFRPLGFTNPSLALVDDVLAAFTFLMIVW